MTHRILEAKRGKLDNVYIVFCNTGKEREETLDFVHKCEETWGVRIIWLEYRHYPEGERKHWFEVVSFATASRHGEPFNQIINPRNYLPNRVARFCTGELKVKTMWRWAKSIGMEEYTKAVGLRADEPERVKRLLRRAVDYRESEDIVCPLAEAGVTLADVMEFSKGQPFDLDLRPEEGNCDLCFLKRKRVIIELMRERPELAKWWIDQESNGSTFWSRKDRMPYAGLLKMAEQPQLFDGLEDDDDLPCACTD
jgi:hypothetical protein